MTTSRITFTVAGWSTCSYFQKAWTVTKAMSHLYPKKVEAVKVELESKDAFQKWLSQDMPKLNLSRGEGRGEGVVNHRTSPFIYLNNNQFLGGMDDLFSYINKTIVSPSSSSSSSSGRSSKNKNRENIPDGIKTGDEKYDYDLVCIGGGSGGLALTKEAANLGAKVACLDFVKPSANKGTTWGLGGTCVNVGCIPKKLCHRAAILGEELKEDAKDFGWSFGNSKILHNWESLQENVHNYIRSLNFKYRVALREKKVSYLNKLGTIKDKHTIETVDKRGRVATITAGRIVVAVGGRPTGLSIPGGEHAIDSDDLFQMDWSSDEEGASRRGMTKNPGKTLVIGASYVALECAGFLTGLGYDTTVMVRSILLRGFDREFSELIGTYMEKSGTHFIKGSVPYKIEKQEEDNRLKVFWNNGTDFDVFDTVITAIGREPDTSKLGLENAKVELSKKNKILCPNQNDQTNISNIYAIGDVVEGMPELTPVAIQAGVLLARRLYGSSSSSSSNSSDSMYMNYNMIPTTVFTPIEYGACGLSEEEAIKVYGEEDIEVYHKEVSPLEWQLSHSKTTGIARCKLICVKSQELTVVGLHILSPNAGEITQGYACALRKNIKFSDFCDTVGIHPTVAEDFTTLSITKASGEDPAAAGC